MSGIINYFNSAAYYAMESMVLCSQAVTAMGAVSSLRALIQHSGLGTPITAVARSLGFLAVPFALGSELLTRAIGKIVPSIYYKSNHIHPSAKGDCYSVSGDPSIYKCNLLGPILLAGISEEILTRGILQRKVLPWIADKLPSSLGNILKNKITRVLLSSLIFAGGHGYDDLSNQFSAGIVWGTIAEVSQSLKVPILSHIMSNGFSMFSYANAPVPS